MFKHNKKLTPIAKTLRKTMTKEEKHLWYDFLREYPIKFCRQKVLGNYVVDFYCAKAQIVIELDGSQHFEEFNAHKDAEREVDLRQFGVCIIRIPNNYIWNNFKGVCQYIDEQVKLRLA